MFVQTMRVFAEMVTYISKVHCHTCRKPTVPEIITFQKHNLLFKLLVATHGYKLSAVTF